MSTYVEFFERAQAEFLNTLKQTQELNLKTLATVTTLASTVPTTTKFEAGTTELPTPTAVVEQAFAFTSQLLEARKEYAIKLAEFATEAQKQFADTAKRFAETSQN